MDVSVFFFQNVVLEKGNVTKKSHIFRDWQQIVGFLGVLPYCHRYYKMKW